MQRKKNRIFGILCILLLMLIWLEMSDLYKMMPGFRKDVITIGVFSDSYWEVQNGYSYQIINDAIELFEKQNPGVRVEYTSGLLKEDYSEWLSEQLILGTAPDVFFVLGEDFNDLAEIGALKDLSSLIREDEDFSPESFYSSAYEYGMFGNAQYTLPFECVPKLMFVNKSILNAEGIDMPDRYWDWDDFYDICERVTKDTDGSGTLDQFGVVGYTWEDAFESNNVRLFNEKGTECYLSDSNAATSIDFIEKLGSLNSGYNLKARDFTLGNVAFQPMLFSEYRAYKSYPLSIKKYSGFEWDCITMPAGPEGDNLSRLDTLSIAMNADTAHAGEAWELMKILTCDEGIQSEIFDYSEGISVLKKVTESKKTMEMLTESSGEDHPMNMEVLSDVMEHAVVVQRFRNYDNAIEKVDKELCEIMEGDSNISMELIIRNREINNYLKGIR